MFSTGFLISIFRPVIGNLQKKERAKNQQHNRGVKAENWDSRLGCVQNIWNASPILLMSRQQRENEQWL